MDILRKQLSVAGSKEFSKDEREDALRCVLYEMVVLALALVQLKNKGEKLKVERSAEELPFGEEQTALEAAALTCRVLIDFLYPKAEKDKSTIPKELKQFYNSLNKWATHLTWERVRKEENYPQPYPEILLKHGPTVLKEARVFVEDCVNKYNYGLTSKNAEPYYDKFLELYAEPVDL